MSKNSPSGHYAVYVSAFQVDDLIPFDCFVLLGKEKLMQWLSAQETLTFDKHQKISSGSIKRVFIREADKAKYFKFLFDYYQSDAGKADILSRDANHWGSADGIPTPNEFDLSGVANLKLPADFGKSSVASPPSPVPPPPPKEKPAGAPVAPVGNVQVVAEPISETGSTSIDDANLIQYLKAKIAELEKNLAQGGGSKEEKTILSNATLRIHNEIMKIKGIMPGDPEAAIKIKDATEIINEQLQIVRGKVGKSKSSAEALAHGARLSEKLGAAVVYVTSSKEKGSLGAYLKKLKAEVSEAAHHLSGALENTSQAIVSKEISSLLEGVEQRIGRSVQLRQNSGFYSEIPEYLTERIANRNMTLNAPASLDSSEAEESFDISDTTDSSDLGVVQGQSSKSSEYTDTLEAENRDLQKTIISLQNKIDSLEVNDSRLQGTIDEGARSVSILRSEIEEKASTIAQLRDSLEIAKREADSARKGVDWAALAEEKNQALEKMAREMELKSSAVTASQKEAVAAAAKLADMKQQNLNIARRLERVVAESEQHKKNERALAGKLEASQNLLRQANLSVEKLTRLLDSVRNEKNKKLSKSA